MRGHRTTASGIIIGVTLLLSGCAALSSVTPGGTVCTLVDVLIMTAIVLAVCVVLVFAANSVV